MADLTPNSQAQAFVQIYEDVSSGPLDADATHPSYAGKWSNVRDFTIPSIQEVGSAESVNGPRSIGRVFFPDVTIVKDTDRTSPVLFAHNCAGQELELVVIEFAVYTTGNTDVPPLYTVFLQGVKVVEFELKQYRLHRDEYDLTRSIDSIDGPTYLSIPTGTHGSGYESSHSTSQDTIKLTYDQISFNVFQNGAVAANSGWDRQRNVPFNYSAGTPETPIPRIWIGS